MMVSCLNDNNKQNHNNNDTCEEIKQLLLYKKNIRANSTNARILQMLYPNNAYTVKQITSQINDKPYPYAKKLILDLQSKKFLEHDNTSHYSRSYQLSQMGRWFVICIKLDNISFQSLCILAAVYDFTKNHPGGIKNAFYITSHFRRLFDESYDDENVSAIYTKRNISHSIKMLIDNDFTYWAYRHILKINPCFFEMCCEMYDKDLTSLAKWNHLISSQCTDRYLDNLRFTENHKRLFGLLTKSKAAADPFQIERSNLTSSTLRS